MPDIPQELILLIIRYALSDSPSKTDIPLLLLSKDLHALILPIFYHTIESGAEGSSPSVGIDRTALFTLANPASLLHVRRLNFCRPKSKPHASQFRAFANLTHLALWDDLGIRYPDAQGIPTLPLEELITWSMAERPELLRSITPECTLTQTLRRFGSYSNWTNEEFEKLQLCQNLSHILVFEYKEYPQAHVRGFLGRENFQCWLVLPEYGVANEEVKNFLKERFSPYQDPRIVVGKHGPDCLFFGGRSYPYFWDDIGTLWNTAETHITVNSNPKAITVMDVELDYVTKDLLDF
ncbi:hypothetical protein DL96DRAFT_1716776 [Flagelloscypha sp. PMI_526]|nr:hypothetical protein DL96DRAFT_1716776 [Flagelloscypha sp. PMI_526]